MHPTTYLGLDEESTKVDETQYRTMIGSLLHLTASIPDIMFSISLRATFQQEPREVFLTEIKCIFRYLIEISNLGLLFKRREDFRFTSFCDADYVGDKVEKQNTSGSCHFIGGNLVT